MNHRGALIFCLVPCLLAAEGCDLFQTREGQPPVQNKSTFTTPFTADIVLNNLTSAIAEYNVDNYMRCFTDTAVRPFEFIPSQETQANYAGIFNRWDLEAERQYFVRLGTPSGTPSLSLSVQSRVVNSDAVTYLMSYTLVFAHRRTDVPRLVRGNMQIFLGADSLRRWSIYRWQDFKTMRDSTWSYWKAVFSEN